MQKAADKHEKTKDEMDRPLMLKFGAEGVEAMEAGSAGAARALQAYMLAAKPIEKIHAAIKRSSPKAADLDISTGAVKAPGVDKDMAMLSNLGRQLLPLYNMIPNAQKTEADMRNGPAMSAKNKALQDIQSGRIDASEDMAANSAKIAAHFEREGSKRESNAIKLVPAGLTEQTA